jgi:hypothetical protein
MSWLSKIMWWSTPQRTTIEPALDKALTGTAKVVKREMEATVDQITSELQEALKG